MGSTSSIVNLYITIFTGLAVGANVVIARLIGAEEKGEVLKSGPYLSGGGGSLRRRC